MIVFSSARCICGAAHVVNSLLDLSTRSTELPQSTLLPIAASSTFLTRPNIFPNKNALRLDVKFLLLTPDMLHAIVVFLHQIFVHEDGSLHSATGAGVHDEGDDESGAVSGSTSLVAGKAAKRTRRDLGLQRK